MNEIRFLATIGEDGAIQAPAGLALPEGEVEIIVRPPIAAPSSAARPSSEEDEIDSLRDLLLSIAAESEALAIELPSDMAENHDHYAHGKPRP